MNTPRRPDHDKLFQLASEHSGYFTARQARAAGFDANLLKHHVRRGRFLRIRRGVYRLSQYPPSPDDHVVEVWLAAVAAGADAVVSHESALRLHGLSDVVPSSVHMTVPRSQRWLGRRVSPGVTVHTTTSPLRRSDVITRGPLQVTAPARSIVDAADAGTAPEQILLAVRQSLAQGLTTARALGTQARGRSSRVEQLIDRGIRDATAP